MSDETMGDPWQKKLTEEQYRVCRLKGTEPPGTGAYLHNKEEGTYLCVACGQELFSSTSKYDSGSGWPSFYEEIQDGSIKETRDSSHGMVRTEITCGRCDSHLGHVFEDGPHPTGMRYCVNSVSLKFEPGQERPGN